MYWHRIVKFAVAVLFALLLLVGSLWGGSTRSAHASGASVPFICDGTVFISRGNSTSSTLFAVDSTTKPFTLNPLTGAETFQYNTIGFNIVDGLIYGLVRSVDPPNYEKNQFMSIDAAGNIINYGLADVNPSNSYSGDVSTDGIFYMIAGNKIYAYDTQSPDFPKIEAGYPKSLSINTNPADLAFNPADGLLYGIAGTRLVVIDTMGTVTRTSTSVPSGANYTPIKSAGASWFDASGTFFAYQNSGSIYKIDTDTAESVLVSTATKVSTNDGTGCAYAPIITKRPIPEQTIPGQTVTWRFDVTNGLQTQTMTVGISDTLPAGFTFVDATLNINGAVNNGTANAYGGTDFLDIDGIVLPAGGAIAITIDALVSFDVTEGTYYNQGYLTDLFPSFGGVKPSDYPKTPELDDPTPVEIIASAEIDLQKTLLSNADGDGSGDVSVDDVLTFQFVSTNQGAVRLRNVAITDTLTGVSPLDCAPNTPVDLLPLESITCTATYTVTQSDINNGSINNSALVAGLDPSGDVVFDEDVASVSAEIDPSITLSKTLYTYVDADTSSSITEGDTLWYRTYATNNGNVTLYNAFISDPQAIFSNCEAITQPFTLVPDQTEFCRFAHVVTAQNITDGIFINTATVTATVASGQVVKDSDTTSTLTPFEPSLELVKQLSSNADEDATSTVSLNDTLMYSFTVTNDGDSTLTNVTLTDTLPNLSALSCSVSLPTTLNQAESFACTATYQVTQTDVDAGVVNNTAVVTGTSTTFGAVLTDQSLATVPIPRTPAIDLTKTMINNADEDGSNTVTKADTLTYRFVSQNIGNVTLSNVTVSDPMSGLSALSCSPALGSSLTPNASMTCTATYTVQQADIDNGLIINEAATTGSAPDGATVTDNDKETVEAEQDPGISLDKSYTSNEDEDGSGTVNLNDTLNFAFSAENIGNTTLTNVTITDTLMGVSGLACSPAMPATLLPSETIDCTASYTVQQSDIDFGKVVNKAIAYGTDPNGGIEDDEDVVGVTTPQNPSLTLDKTRIGSGDVALNEIVTYQLVATNDGDVTLTNAIISETLAGVSPLSCTPTMPTALAPGASITCTATYTVTQTDVNNGTIDNVATVIGTDPLDNQHVITDDLSVVADQVPSITLDKIWTSGFDADSSGGFSAGDTLTYTFSVQNDGSVTLFSVTVSDPLPDMSAVTCLPAQGSTLLPGETMSCTASYVVKSADEAAGKVVNTATVAGQDINGNVISDSDTETVPPEVEAQIDLVKAMIGNNDPDGNGLPTISDTITYVFTATNPVTVTLTDVQIVDPMSGLSVLNCDAPAPVTLTFNATLRCTATYTITQADVDRGYIANTATVTGTDPFILPVTDVAVETVPVPQRLDIQLDKSYVNADGDASGSVTVGDTITFTLHYTNAGYLSLDSTLVDPLSGLSSLNCLPALPKTLAYRETGRCTATYTVTQADIDEGYVRNTATITGTAVTSEVDTDVDSEFLIAVSQSPAVVITKSVAAISDPDSSGSTTAGDVISYVFTATNTGNVTLFGTIITDTKSGLSPLVCTPTMPLDLAPNGSIQCTAFYTVTQADADLGVVRNTATVEGTSPQGDGISAESSVATPVAHQPSIALTKTYDGYQDLENLGTLGAGDQLTFTLTITNDGDVMLSNVILTDTLDGAVVSNCTKMPYTMLNIGESFSCTVTYTVTILDVEARTVTNTAQVSGVSQLNQTVSASDSAVSEMMFPEPTNVRLRSSGAAFDVTGRWVRLVGVLLLVGMLGWGSVRR